jgi:hypothetical protein
MVAASLFGCRCWRGQNVPGHYRDISATRFSVFNHIRVSPMLRRVLYFPPQNSNLHISRGVTSIPHIQSHAATGTLSIRSLL